MREYKFIPGEYPELHGTRIERFPFIRTSGQELSDLGYVLYVECRYIRDQNHTKIRLSFNRPGMQSLRIELWVFGPVLSEREVRNVFERMNSGYTEFVPKNNNRSTDIKIGQMVTRPSEIPPKSSFDSFMDHPDLESLELAIMERINEVRSSRIKLNPIKVLDTLPDVDSIVEPTPVPNNVIDMAKYILSIDDKETEEKNRAYAK